MVRCCSDADKRGKFFVLNVFEKLLKKWLAQLPKDANALRAKDDQINSVYLMDWASFVEEFERDRSVTVECQEMPSRVVKGNMKSSQEELKLEMGELHDDNMDVGKEVGWS